MTPTAGQLGPLFSSSESRPSTRTMVASSPATLQPDPSSTFPIPYLPARIPLSPPPYRNTFVHTVFSKSSSPAISPTTIPTTTRPRHCPLATPFPFETAPPTKSTVSFTRPEPCERTGWANAHIDPQPFPEAYTILPWGPIAWTASNPAKETKSLVWSADSYMSYTSRSHSSRAQPNAPNQPGSEIFLKRWLREQARFHACDDFANQTGFIPSEEPSGGGYPGPRQMLPSEVSATFPGRRGSEGSMDWTQGDGCDKYALY